MGTKTFPMGPHQGLQNHIVGGFTYTEDIEEENETVEVWGMPGVWRTTRRTGWEASNNENEGQDNQPELGEWDGLCGLLVAFDH